MFCHPGLRWQTVEVYALLAVLEEKEALKRV
jgi:hypothetical protein